MSGIPTIGDVVREWRQYRKISLTDFCQQTKLSKSYVSELEHNKIDNPKKDKLGVLSAALGITVMDIVSRRMPPEVEGEGDNKVTQAATQVAPAQQLPPAAGVDGGVLQQILVLLQQLTGTVGQLMAAVAQLQANVAQNTAILSHLPQQVIEALEELLRLALGEQTYHAPPARPENASRLLQTVRLQQITGRWEGFARQKLQEGAPLTFSLERRKPKRIVVPRAMTLVIAARLTLERTSDSELSGKGELEFDFRPFDIEFVKTVPVTITEVVFTDGGITLQLQNSNNKQHLAHISGTLSEDGRMFSGTYLGLGLIGKRAYKRNVKGEFSMEKLGVVQSSERIGESGY